MPAILPVKLFTSRMAAVPLALFVIIPLCTTKSTPIVMAKCTTQSWVSDSDENDNTMLQSQQSTVIDIDDEEPPQKKTKGDDLSLTVAAFNKRYKVDTRTNKEVLGESTSFPLN